MITRTDLPEHERSAVTDEELRCANQTTETDEQFRARLNMPELIGQRPRMGRGETGYKVDQPK